MEVSPLARVGAIISTLGGIVILIGFCLPLAFTSSNVDYVDTYPPVLNGWQVIQAMPLASPLAMIALLLALGIISTSFLVAIQRGEPPFTTIRAVATVASVPVLLWLPWLIFAPSFASSPDGANASPQISLGIGLAVMLSGAALSALGSGLVGIGGLIGALLGASLILVPFIGFLMLVLNADFFTSAIGSIAGALLGRKILRSWQKRRAEQRSG